VGIVWSAALMMAAVDGCCCSDGDVLDDVDEKGVHGDSSKVVW